MSGIYSALGRIGRDAEQRQTQNGTAVAGWPLAVDVGFGDNKQTLWLDCSLWGKRAESGLVPLLTKGRQVWVCGELATREFQKRDGTPGFAVTLKVSEITLASDGGQQQQRQQPQQAPQQQTYQHAQAQYAQQQAQVPPHQQGGPHDPGAFDDEIPFMRMHPMQGG